jgi:hypothetical protein
MKEIYVHDYAEYVNPEKDTYFAVQFHINVKYDLWKISLLLKYISNNNYKGNGHYNDDDS